MEQLVSSWVELHGLERKPPPGKRSLSLVRSAWKFHRGHSTRRLEELSKGMQQKIQFIASLLHEPDLIIMDEPFSGLDPVNAAVADGHPGRSCANGWQSHPLLHAPHGPGGKTLRRHRASSFAGQARARRLHARGQGSQYPRNRVQMSFRPVNGQRFLQLPCGYSRREELFAGIAEAHGSPTQRLLPTRCWRRRASPVALRVSRFEVMEPTLEEIFIETVRGTPDFGDRRVWRHRQMRNVFLVARREYSRARHAPRASSSSTRCSFRRSWARCDHGSALR